MTAPEPVAMVRNVSRGDVLWDRPIFKAPPLEPLLRRIDAAVIAAELRTVGPALR